jgi:hypothetical protein
VLSKRVTTSEERRRVDRTARRLAKNYWVKPALCARARRDAVAEALLEGGALFVEKIPFKPKPDSYFLDKVGPRKLRFELSRPAPREDLKARVDALAGALLGQRDAANARRRKSQPSHAFVSAKGLDIRGLVSESGEKRVQARLRRAAPASQNASRCW